MESSIAEQLIKLICEYYKQKIENVLSTRRDREYVKCRQVAMYFMRNCLDLSRAKIGKHFPGKKGCLNRTTVIHALKTVNNLIDTDKYFAQEIEAIKLKLQGKDSKTPEQIREHIKTFEKDQLEDEIVRLNNRIMVLETELRIIKIVKIDPEQKVVKMGTKHFDSFKEMLQIKEPIERETEKFISPFASVPACNTGEYSGYVKHCVNL